MRMIPPCDVRGRSLVEVIAEMFIILVLAPAIVCCIVQGITTIAAIALPLVAIVLIAIGVAACFAAVLASYRGGPRHLGPPPGGGVPMLPPIRRPPGVPGPREERREHRGG
jgi:hypothetical protein